MKHISDVTAKTRSSEKFKQVIYVNRKWRTNCPLSDSIPDWELWWKLSSPLHITLLVLIYEQQHPEEDSLNTPLSECCKQLHPPHYVKGIAQVNGAAIDSPAIVQVVVNDRGDCPGTHGGTSFGLEAKLHDIAPKFVTL